MTINSRGHEVPAGGDGWGYKEDMNAFSASISSVVTVPDLTTAADQIANLVEDSISPDGTLWWVSGEETLYVYKGSEVGLTPVWDLTRPTRPRAGYAAVTAVLGSGQRIGTDSSAARVMNVIDAGVADFPRLVTYSFNTAISAYNTNPFLCRSLVAIGDRASLPADPSTMTILDTGAAAWTIRQSMAFVFRGGSSVDIRSGEVSHTEFIPAGSSSNTAAVAACHLSTGDNPNRGIIADGPGYAAECWWVEVDPANLWSDQNGRMF